MRLALFAASLKRPVRPLRVPVRIKLELREPVPVLMTESASPLLAQSSRCACQIALGILVSMLIFSSVGTDRLLYLSSRKKSRSAACDSMPSTTFVRSRQSKQLMRNTPVCLSKTLPWYRSAYRLYWRCVWTLLSRSSSVFTPSIPPIAFETP